MLAWTLVAPPTNDDFSSPTALTGARGSLGSSTAGATKQSGEPDHAENRGGASVWFRWRAPRAMRVAFMTCGSSFDTVIAVYRGASVDSLKLLDANDDGCERGSLVVVGAQAGVTYDIAVDGYRGSNGDFRLAWGPPPKGTDVCFVPDVRGGKVAQARRLLTRAGCTLGAVHRTPSLLVPRGRVVSQSPQPGRRVAYGTRVQLEVSTGRP
jgi:hypothetical protein